MKILLLYFVYRKCVPRLSFQGVRNMNPIPYHAGYFGHKLHMDQNEKLAMFGVTHVIAIDGYSSYIVGYSTMSRKNNLTIYADVYRYVFYDYLISISNTHFHFWSETWLPYI